MQSHTTRLTLSAGLLLLVLFLAGQARPSAAAPKLVFAHYMLWVPSTSDDVSGFITDIKMAQAAGIDGFAINTADWSAVNWAIPRCDKIWQAAETLNSGFKLFFSVDLTGSLGNMAGDIVAMAARYANRPNTLKVDGKVFLSTFVGQDKTFGYPTPQQGWDQAVLTPLRNQGVPVYFIPFFAPNNERPGQVGYPSPSQVSDVFAQFPFMDGIYQWSAWPFFYGDLQTVSNQADVNYLSAARANGKSYMAPISPWFSKHMAGAPVTLPNWVFGNYKGPGMWIDHWNSLIALQPDFVEIVTWNDYPERTYIGPTTAPWGDDEDVTFPHLGFLDLTKYFVQAYKSGGQYPNIDQEKVYVFYRSSSKYAVANDPLGPIQNSQSMDDNIYVVTLLNSPADVIVTSGSSSGRFSVNGGLKNVTMAFQQGSQSVQVVRNGQVLGQKTFAKQISNNIAVYDFNVFSDVLVL